MLRSDDVVMLQSDRRTVRYNCNSAIETKLKLGVTQVRYNTSRNDLGLYDQVNKRTG